ncbi:MAG TPA: hypothetical protein DDZ80_16850 [Cyanobacteria bacterium UBA8803]|nr:hypothetical protein [Cyanobacteria bacterium UBA9273]HBL60069.1 hypothetical protein [Cyanobacteria bacterium UBA8803]
MNQTDFSELAALYALDVLDELACRSVEETIAEFPEWEMELKEFQAAVATLPYSAPLVPMAGDLKERLFERIATLTCVTDTTPVVSTSIAQSVQALKARVAEVSWEPYLIPGVMVGKLDLDVSKREIACFIRAEAGVQFPNHRHAANEEVVVLEGDLVIDGELYGRGECIRSVPGSAHQPETYGGCLIFLRTSLDDEIIV